MSLFALLALLVPPIAGVSANALDTHSDASTSLYHAGDYTFGYYPYGWRRPKNEAPIRYAVQTNHYAFLLDASKGHINRLGPIINPPDATSAVVQGNEVLETLPAAELTFAMTWNGRTFPVGNGTTDPRQVWLYRVGKYLQHFAVQHVQIGGLSSGAGLEGVHAWMEGYG